MYWKSSRKSIAILISKFEILKYYFLSTEFREKFGNVLLENLFSVSVEYLGSNGEVQPPFSC